MAAAARAALAGFDVQGIRAALKQGGGPHGLAGGGSIARRRAASGGVVAADDVGQAVDGVLQGIRGELAKNDLLVCWLIDASISLADDRQVIAERIEPFYREIEAQDKKKSHKLASSVVAFSDTTWEVIKPTDFSSQIVQAVRNLPLATSGVENVMGAIDSCLEQYARRWKGSIVIVVWTDESGDDVLQLESIIQKCKRRGVMVSVVGPTAVLGSEQGRHHYVDKGTGFAFLIPIKRGPDTSLPERLFLPYWHDSPLAPWSRDDIMAASGTPWYGGPHREGLLSGVGPYALTRLALETGGTFTLLDRKEDRGPFQWDVMKKYLPDYASVADYVALTNSKPLRKAVSGARWPPTNTRTSCRRPRLSCCTGPSGIRIRSTLPTTRPSSFANCCFKRFRSSRASPAIRTAWSRWGSTTFPRKAWSPNTMPNIRCAGELGTT